MALIFNGNNMTRALTVFEIYERWKVYLVAKLTGKFTTLFTQSKRDLIKYLLINDIQNV